MTLFRNRWFIPCLLLLLFLLPGLLAIWFYFHAQVLPGQRTNRGELLKQPLLISPMNSKKIAPKWRMIYWSPQPCHSQCQRLVDQLARIRLALGRHAYEVEVALWLGKNASSIDKTFAMQLHDNQIDVLKLPAMQDSVAHLLPDSAQIYLQNPKGYLVMGYLPTAKPDDIYHDLKRLLNMKES